MRTVILALVLALSGLHGSQPIASSEPAIGVESNVVIFILRRSDRGTDYKALDIVDVMDAYRADGTLRGPWLPPAEPFAYIKVEGITMTEAQEFTYPDFNPDGTVRNKRQWGFRTQSIPASVRQFFLANWFVGFGSVDDIAFYGATVNGDVVLDWATVQTWMRKKP